MSLAWGRHYVMVEPSHFRIDYVINPFMDPARPARPRPGAGPVAHPRRDHRAARRHRRRDPAAAGRARHGLRDEPRPRGGPAPRRRRPRAARRDVAHALRAAPDGDRVGAAVVRRRTASPRRTSAGTASARTSSRATSFPFGDALVAGFGPRTEELALKHLAAGPRRPGPRAADHPPGHVPPRPGLLPARRPPRDRLPRRARPGLGRRAAEPGARAAGAHRGGGADHLRRQLDRRPLGHRRPGDRRDAGRARPRARPARGSGASTSSSSTSRSSTRPAARSAA